MDDSTPPNLASLRDIANAASVSVSTVSRAVRDGRLTPDYVVDGGSRRAVYLFEPDTADSIVAWRRHYDRCRSRRAVGI